MPTVAVSPEVLEWAQIRSGIEASKLLKVFPKLRAWGRTEEPSLAQLEKLARKTHTPLGYFFLKQPPKESLPVADFRTVNDRPIGRLSADLMATVYSMQLRQDWTRGMLVADRADPLPFAGRASMRARPESLAASIRATLGLSEGWASRRGSIGEALREFRDRAEDAGVFVVINGVVANNTRRPLDPEEFRGFVLPDPHAPFVFVNGADFKGAQMFTLAHELAHVWLGKGAVFNLERLQPADDPTERFCNEVAAELLVPRAELQALWSSAGGAAQAFEAIAPRFKVSPIVVARRALDLLLVPRRAYFDFYDEYVRRERKKAKSTGGNFFANQDYRVGRRFTLAVMTAAEEGRLPFRDAYRLTDLHGATLDKYVARLGARF
jgi:Zn-dependent peptidase ImmA (M78 family)